MDFDFHFPPILKKLKRGPQIILPKDLGIIVAFTGMNKKSIVADAGTGSGFATIFFASIAKKVITYEVRKEFVDFARKNIERSGLKNIELKEADVFAGIDEKIDILNLDLPSPERVFSTKFDLKEGGFVVSYLPNIEQVIAFVREANKYGFKTFTVEIMLRDIWVREFGTRPQSKGIMHTGYVTFANKE